LPAFDFDAAVRWAKLDRRGTLARRPDRVLPFLATAEPGAALLLDTCVYIDQLQGQAPKAVNDLVQLRLSNHSTVAVAELLHPVGRLDPNHPSTRKAIAQIRETVLSMPEHRVLEPGMEVTGRAALLSGVLCRLQGYRADDRLRSLHDCIIFLQALANGLTVLTRNVRDFDILMQMVPAGRVLFYRT
jgi:predicted nucleic acid-binding protein